MTLASMKTSDADCMPSCEPNPYGYGLSISLNPDQVAALGLLETPIAGGKVGLRALAYICSVTSEADGEDSDTEVCLRLQITDLEVTPAGAGISDSSVSMLYTS